MFFAPPVLGCLVSQLCQRQTLARSPESSPITTGTINVIEYNRAMETTLGASYVCAIDLLHRALPDRSRLRAVDLACGPGHFTVMLVQHLHFDSVCGVDLSAEMIGLAEENARQSPSPRACCFESGDVRSLPKIAPQSADLVTWTFAAHHMACLDDLRRVFREMERISRDDGVVLILDLVRLKTGRLTERFVNLIAVELDRLGLHQLREDYRESMYAAWTVEELVGAIPKDSARGWYSVVPAGLPMLQFVIGVPGSRQRLFPYRAPRDWCATALLPPGTRGIYRIARLLLTLRQPRRVV